MIDYCFNFALFHFQTCSRVSVLLAADIQLSVTHNFLGSHLLSLRCRQVCTYRIGDCQVQGYCTIATCRIGSHELVILWSLRRWSSS